MSFIFGILLPVLTYGVLCAYLGIWVRTTYLTHWKKR